MDHRVCGAQSMLWARFEQKNGHLAQVEVDEVLVSCVITGVPPHDAVSAGAGLTVKLLGIILLLTWQQELSDSATHMSP